MKWLPVIVLISAMSPDVLAWGPLGHSIVCDIAWRFLDTPLREKVSSTANRMGYRTFAQSCVWADSIRSNPRFDSLKTLHYVNVPKLASSVNRPRDCPGNKKPNCVLTAISYYQQRWQNSDLSQQQRDQALLLLGHFAGDIHQPMHVSYEFDRGGNRRIVEWIGNEAISLHRFWDTTIIDCDNKISWRQLAHQLYVEITPQQQQRWAAIEADQERSIDQWANESLSVTRDIYAYLEKPWNSLDHCQRFTPAARQRLQMAAVRLASLLHD